MSSAAPPRRLLLVEDNPDDAELLALLIARTGRPWIVERVATLEGARRRLREGRFNVILVDLGLPDGRGLRAVREVMSHAPGVPLVALSGAAPDDAVARVVQVATGQECVIKGAALDAGLARVLDTIWGPRP